MRRILVEQARRKQAAKRGGQQERIELVDVPAKDVGSHVDLLALDQALTELAGTDARAAELVKLRYFAGLSVADAAGALEISARTADRTWLYAHQLATIVTPGTVLRWIREEKEGRGVPAKRGRRRTPTHIRRLILKLARENEWGYTRILGELKKLGVRSISKNTVKRILKDAGFDPGPKRGEGTWDDFLKQHAASLWQCDFFSKRVLTLNGIREAFVITFLNVKTRQAVLSPATLHPNEEWVVSQPESFVKQARREGLPVARIQHDRDTKFTKAFDETLMRCRAESVRNAFRSPNTNAYVERFIQSISQECLDRFVIFGEQHMDHLCAEDLAHYHEERPHQSLENEPPKQPTRRGPPRKQRCPLAEQIVPLSEVHCKQRLGGLLKQLDDWIVPHLSANRAPSCADLRNSPAWHGRCPSFCRLVARNRRSLPPPIPLSSAASRDRKRDLDLAQDGGGVDRIPSDKADKCISLGVAGDPRIVRSGEPETRRRLDPIAPVVSGNEHRPQEWRPFCR